MTKSEEFHNFYMDAGVRSAMHLKQHFKNCKNDQ